VKQVDLDDFLNSSNLNQAVKGASARFRSQYPPNFK